MNKIKQQGKKVVGVILGVALSYVSYNIADKYFNQGSAEDNLRTHIKTLYNKVPDAVKCANVDTSNYDSRVTCEALMDGVPKVYLCAGFLDGFDSSCIPMRNYGKIK